MSDNKPFKTPGQEEPLVLDPNRTEEYLAALNNDKRMCLIGWGMAITDMQDFMNQCDEKHHDVIGQLITYVRQQCQSFAEYNVYNEDLPNSVEK